MSYLWCLHCERVYLKEQWLASGVKAAELESSQALKESMEMHGECPNCSAYGLIDGWEWSKVSIPNGYPEKPEIGGHYPLYKEETEK